ncbi:MAG: hypothetical protein M0R74_19695, partial [Dehalococcoidia bacterium]|nr:hypothetical protein [Dehalococcoidia bacterium]
MQSVIERAAVPGKSTTNREAWDEYIDSFILGGLTGGVAGGAGGVVGKQAADRQKDTPTQQNLQTDPLAAELETRIAEADPDGQLSVPMAEAPQAEALQEPAAEAPVVESTTPVAEITTPEAEPAAAAPPTPIAEIDSTAATPAQEAPTATEQAQALPEPTPEPVTLLRPSGYATEGLARLAIRNKKMSVEDVDIVKRGDKWFVQEKVAGSAQEGLETVAGAKVRPVEAASPETAMEAPPSPSEPASTVAENAKEPWQMTREEFEANPPQGFQVKKLDKEDIARAESDGTISVDPENFFGHAAKERKDIIAHERAHFIEEKITPEYKASLFDNPTVMNYRGRNINEKLANMIQDGTVPPEVLADYPDLAPKPAITIEPAATTPTPLTRDVVEQVFPGQDIYQTGDNYMVVLKNGSQVQIEGVDDISPNEASLRVGYSQKSLKPGQRIGGFYNRGEIKVLRDNAGSQWLLAHESIHWLEDLGLITLQEQALINARAKKEGMWKGKLSPAENRANWLADFQAGTRPKTTVLGRLWDKVVEFAKKIAGVRTAQAVAKDIQAGKVFERRAEPLTKGLPQYATKEGTQTQEDRDYLDAVNRGDMDAAQKMVDAAARRAGYTVFAWKGYSEFPTSISGLKPVGAKPLTVIDRQSEFPSFHGGEKGVKISGFFSNSKSVAKRFADPYSDAGAINRFALRLGNTKIFDAKGKAAGGVQFGSTGVDFRNAIRSGKYDSISILNTSDEEDVFVTLSPDQSKLADPVTYDDSGNVIPLSERFEDTSPDIRYAITDTLKRAIGTATSTLTSHPENLPNAFRETLYRTYKAAQTDMTWKDYVFLVPYHLAKKFPESWGRTWQNHAIDRFENRTKALAESVRKAAPFFELRRLLKEDGLSHAQVQESMARVSRMLFAT